MKKIRLWKLGHIDTNNVLNSMLPTKNMIERFRNTLKENLSVKDGGTVDLIWGPDIDVELVEIDETVENYIIGQDGKLEKI
jgi:hypothetical protein